MTPKRVRKGTVLVELGIPQRQYVEERAKSEFSTMAQVIRDLIRKGLKYEELMEVRKEDVKRMTPEEIAIRTLEAGDIIDLSPNSLPHAS